MAAPAQRWHGWFRPDGKGHPWRALCEADSRGRCWALLLKRLTGSGEGMVIEDGRHPEETSARRRLTRKGG
jgi:hypothetical protein